MSFYLLTLTIIIADQALKQLVNSTMSVGQVLPLLGRFLSLTYVRNTGAAFSILTGSSPLLIIISLFAAGLMVYFQQRLTARDWTLKLGLALLLGGTLGNLFDRLVRHYVIDYIDFKVWPVFNLADIMIDLGVGLIILVLFKKKGD
ncbi:MAG: signal peptidase II [Candidatus Margulisiibacteriota bacterium]|jgi:signal peptidase II